MPLNLLRKIPESLPHSDCPLRIDQCCDQIIFCVLSGRQKNTYQSLETVGVPLETFEGLWRNFFPLVIPLPAAAAQPSNLLLPPRLLKGWPSLVSSTSSTPIPSSPHGLIQLE